MLGVRGFRVLAVKGWSCGSSKRDFVDLATRSNLDGEREEVQSLVRMGWAICQLVGVEKSEGPIR